MIKQYYNKYTNTFHVKIFFTCWHSLKIAPNIYLKSDLGDIIVNPKTEDYLAIHKDPILKAFLVM